MPEFTSLVSYLQPQIASRLGGNKAVLAPEAFRQRVAPVYLRRNQDDVLTELPELVEIEEWTELDPGEGRVYRDAVLDGNFMAMRRAAFATNGEARPQKLQRLVEICDDESANGRKVVVFSYFRDVLSTVADALGSRVHGSRTGRTPAGQRQQLIDSFASAQGPAVLVSCGYPGGYLGAERRIRPGDRGFGAADPLKRRSHGADADALPRDLADE